MLAPNYCLRCFMPLPEGEQTAQNTCSRCSFVSTRSMRLKYWNLDPGLLRLQGLIKLVTALGCIVLSGAMAFSLWGFPGGHGGTGAGGFILLPLFLAVGIWATAEKLTRRHTYFRASIFWGVACGICGSLVLTFDPVSGLCILAFALCVVWLGRRFRTWRQARIREGAEAV